MRKIFNRDIDWYLLCAARALGLKSSLGGQIFCLESGGPNSGFRSPEWKGDPKEIQRARELDAVWRALFDRAQSILLAQYVGRLPTEMLNKHREAEGFSRFPTGVAGEFDAPGVALFLALENGEMASLVGACKDKSRSGSRALLDKYEQLSHQAQVFAHMEWADAYRLRSPKAQRIREMFR